MKLLHLATLVAGLGGALVLAADDHHRPSKTCTTATSSATPTPTQCTDDQYSQSIPNFDFNQGLQNWTVTTDSRRGHERKVAGTGPFDEFYEGNNTAAYLRFPKGRTVTTTLSVPAVACAGVYEGVGVFYGLIQGGNCHLRASIPPLLNFIDEDLHLRDDLYIYSDGFPDTFGQGLPYRQAIPTNFSVTVTCDGSQESYVWFDQFYLGVYG